MWEGSRWERYIGFQSSGYHVFFFFFSSRRRHTRFDCDWSSDVCSSDLLPKSRTRSASCSQEILACSGERNTSSGNRMSPSWRPMVVSGLRRSKRCTAAPLSSSSTRTMGGGALGGGPPVAAGDRRSGAGSTSGAPHVGQNLVPAATGEPQRPQLGPEPGAGRDRGWGAGRRGGARRGGRTWAPAATGEPQRPQLGPEPGAVRRRPQCGQNGRRPLARPPQKGHVSASGRVGATTGGATPRGPGTAVPTAARLTPEALPTGLPPAPQNCAPASFSRPQ